VEMNFYIMTEVWLDQNAIYIT